MLKKKILILSILMITMFAGCSPKPEELYSVKLVHSGDLEFPLDNYSSLFSTCIKMFIEDGDEHLYVLNAITNSINIYNLKDTTSLEVLTFEESGPEGTGKIDGFDVHSRDSIFLISSSSYKASIVSMREKDTVITTIKLIDKNQDINYTAYSDYQSSIFKYKNDIYIHSTPFSDPLKTKPFQVGNSMLKVNLKTSEISNLNTFSEAYDGLWPSGFFKRYSSLPTDANRVIFSFPIDNNIQVYDLTSKESINHKASSVHFDEIKEYDLSLYKDNTENFKKHYINEGHYGQIFYDKFRNVYYRFAYIPDYVGIQNNDPRVETKIPSVIILNESFEKIGEQKLEKYEFLPIMSFVGKEGLYINQPRILDRETWEIQEDVFRFVLFKLDYEK